MVQCPILTDEQRHAMREFHANARFSTAELNLQRNVQVFAMEDQPVETLRDQGDDSREPPDNPIHASARAADEETTVPTPLAENGHGVV